MEIAHVSETAEWVEFCTCSHPPVPYDHLKEIDKTCPTHGVRPILFDLDAAAVRVEKESQSPMAVFSLVQAGWERQGAGWTHPNKKSHLSQAKAFATLLWEDGTQI